MEIFRNSSVFLAPLMCHGSRDAMAATGSAPCGWLLLTGRDNTCKYNPAGFHGAFNVSRACGMDIAHACPRVENFRKKWEAGEKSGAEFRTCPDLDNSSCGIIIFCDWSLDFDENNREFRGFFAILRNVGLYL